MTDSEQQPLDPNQLQTRLERAIRRSRRWYMVQGILFLVAGVLALLLPNITVIGVELLLGALLIISGAYQIYQGSVDHSGWLLFSGLLSAAVGVAMLLLPMAGAIALATLIAIFLLLEGLLEIILSINMRFSSSWGWLMASGVLSLLLGALLLFGWPEQTVFLAGIILGVNFLFYGAAILAVVASTRHP